MEKSKFPNPVQDLVYFAPGDCAKISFEDFDLELRVNSAVRCSMIMSKGIVELNFKHLDVQI